MKYREMALAIYYVTSSRNTPLEVRHLNISQKGRIRCLELGNFKN